MTTVIIQYPLPPGAPIDAVKSGFLEVAPFFQHLPGLLRKYFFLSEDGATGGGVYLWTSRETARNFSETTIRPMIKEKFHVEPSITYFEAPVIVDNVSSQILS
jgi:Putative mono-oxygenase ydhR